MKPKLSLRIKCAIIKIIVKALMRLMYSILIIEKRKLPIYADRAFLFAVYLTEIMRWSYILYKKPINYVYVNVGTKAGRIYAGVWPPIMRIDPKVEKATMLQIVEMLRKGAIKFEEEDAKRKEKSKKEKQGGLK